MKLHKKRLLCALLCTAMLTVGLASCQKKDAPPPDDTADTTPAHTQPEKENIVFPKNGMDRFKIVYADGSSDDVISAANSLSKMILSTCGVEPLVTNDFLRENSSTFCEYEYEILIGKTNRKESGAFVASLRQDDYGYICSGTKIVIAAHDDYLLMQAVNNFTVQVVMGKKTDEIFFCTEWEKISQESYNIDSFTLNGTNIADYRIVYPAISSEFEKALAGKLQLAIADASGYMLSTVSDRASEGESVPEILIGATTHRQNPTDLDDISGYLSGNGTTVSLYGKNAAGIGEAVNAFLARMTGATQNKSCALSFAEPQTITPDRTRVKSMSFNILTSSMNNLRTQRVVSTILRELPDTLGVQEANVNWMSLLKSELSGYYACVGTGTESTTGKGNEHCAIFYNKNRFTLEESATYWLTSTPTVNSELPGSDYPRVYTYVVLKDKTTGERFLHLNTHLDTATSEIRVSEVLLLLEFLSDYNDLPVILSGDLNSYMTSTEMQTLFDNGLIQSEVALGRTDHTPTFLYNPVTIDYVLATTDCLEVLDYTVDNERIFGDFASDHYAITLTFRFKNPEGGINHGWGDPTVSYPDEWLNTGKQDELFDGEFYPIP